MVQCLSSENAQNVPLCSIAIRVPDNARRLTVRTVPSGCGTHPKHQHRTVCACFTGKCPILNVYTQLANLKCFQVIVFSPPNATCVVAVPPTPRVYIKNLLRTAASSFQDGPYQADCPQIHRRQGPQEAARHQGCPQKCSRHRRSEEASQIQARHSRPP